MAQYQPLLYYWPTGYKGHQLKSWIHIAQKTTELKFYCYHKVYKKVYISHFFKINFQNKHYYLGWARLKDPIKLPFYVGSGPKSSFAIKMFLPGCKIEGIVRPRSKF